MDKNLISKQPWVKKMETPLLLDIILRMIQRPQSGGCEGQIQFREMVFVRANPPPYLSLPLSHAHTSTHTH